jgi:hypothetical protein
VDVKGPRAATEWSAAMGWRYVAYNGREGTMALQIEPMVTLPDIVYVPDDSHWLSDAPDWAKPRRAEILGRLQSIAWRRDLNWRVGVGSFTDPVALPGSLESTPGGQHLEKERLFDPTSPMAPDQSRLVWHTLVRRFVAQVRGRVRVYASEVIPGSVFAEIELPALRTNPDVQLDLR